MYCRLLIVDDDQMVLDALRRELMREPHIGVDGIEVETFQSPAEALTRITEADGDFDVAIVDYGMPQMDGIAFLDLLRSRRPDTIRILITGSIDLEGSIAAINSARVNHLITKPWHEYDLKSRVALALREREIGRGKNIWLGESDDFAHPFRLLLVDDDQSLLNALVREMSMQGRLTREPQPLFDIVTATSARQALVSVANRCPDIVLSDYAMPDMDGVELLYQVRGRCPRCVRILMSGRNDLTVLQQAINVAGVYHFVGKPWDAGEMRVVVTEALTYRRLLMA
jgi:DNA-binding NtrC family response regulator